MRGHLINENKFNNNVIGSSLLAGRYFLYGKKRDILHAEWYFFKKATSSFSCKMEIGAGEGDDGLMFHVAIPKLFSIFIIIDRVFGKMFKYPKEPRAVGFSYFDSSFSFYTFSKVNSWSSRDPWYSKGFSFSPRDFIVGRYKYTEENSTEWKPIVVPMVEGSYKGKARLFDGVWKNRFFTKRIRRADIEMEEGIPFPGKGENSWDCGENCSYGLTCSANSFEKAIAVMFEHILCNRRRYGSYGSMLSYTPTQKYPNNSHKNVDISSEVATISHNESKL